MTDNFVLLRSAYVLPNLLAAFGMVLVAVLAWRHRHQRGGWALWVFAVAAAIWAFTEGGCFLTSSVDTIVLFWKVGSFGFTVAPLALLWFCVDYLGYGHWLTRRRMVFLILLPVIVFCAAWTNEWHGLIWQNPVLDTHAPFPMVVAGDGSLLFVYYSYITLLALVTVYFLWRRMAALPKQQRRQMRLIIMALCLPLVASTLYMTKLVSIHNMDLTPLGFNFSGFLLVRSFWRERMFELVPVTANEIYRSLEDAVFVIDGENRMQDNNAAAIGLLPSMVGGGIGQLLPELLPDTSTLLCEPGGDVRGEVALGERWFDARVTTLHSVDGRFSGRLLVLHDISERKLLEAELRRLSVTDSLTGLYNRRHFSHHGEVAIRHAQRYARPLSMIMLDVDYFKEVNDRFGHDAGDRVLVALAALLTSELRATDCIGRIGGEEFALLLPETEEAASIDLGHRLLGAVEKMSVPLANGDVIRITLSAGVTTLQAADSGMMAFMRRADGLLYQAKHGGRSRLVSG